MSVGFFAAKKVVPFIGNHFRHSATAVTALQNKLENADAQRLKNSIAALINNKTPIPRPSLGFFAVPKPAPAAKKEVNLLSPFKI